MKPSPLSIVKERFGESDAKKAKASLVKAVKGLAGDALFLERLNEDKGLEHVSNKKLLHLHDVLTRVKDEFGTRDKLIDAIVDLEGRAKDKDFRTRFEAFSTPRLVDEHTAAARRAKRKKSN